jgi:hypothetical protein
MKQQWGCSQLTMIYVDLFKSKGWLMSTIAKLFAKTPEKGSRTSFWCAAAPSSIITSPFQSRIEE